VPLPGSLHGIDLRQDRMALQRLREAAKKAKIELEQALEAARDATRENDFAKLRDARDRLLRAAQVLTAAASRPGSSGVRAERAGFRGRRRRSRGRPVARCERVPGLDLPEHRLRSSSPAASRETRQGGITCQLRKCTCTA
jgi:hypothetical protein